VRCRFIDQINDTPAALGSESEKFRLQAKKWLMRSLVWMGTFIRHSFDIHSTMRYWLTSVSARP